MRKIVIMFLSWRLLLFIPLFASELFLSPRIGFGYTHLTYFLEKSEKLLSHFLIFPFGNFDGAYYLLIAGGGYTATAGFFPLFPLSINYITSIFNFEQFFIAIFLVSIYFFVSLFLFYKLIRLDYKDSIATWSIIFLLIFPTSFFYAAIYSESLFLLLSLLAFYFARKKKWLWAGISGGLLSATRLVGIAILFSLFYEYIKHEKQKTKSKLLYLFLVPLGLLGYIFYNFLKWGNPFYFIQVQGELQNNRSVDSIVLLPQTFFRYIKILFTVNPNIYEWWVAFFELYFCVFALSLLFAAWKKRVRFSYILFGFLCFIIPASSGTFSGLPRYVVVIFPIFIALALIKNRFLKIIYSLVSVVLLFLFFMLFSKGYFIS